MCGFNATKIQLPIKTLKIEAGSTIGFATAYMTNKDETKLSDPVS